MTSGRIRHTFRICLHIQPVVPTCLAPTLVPSVCNRGYPYRSEHWRVMRYQRDTSAVGSILHARVDYPSPVICAQELVLDAKLRRKAESGSWSGGAPWWREWLPL